MTSRLKKIKEVLRRERADALVVWNSEGVGQPATGWLSGFWGTASVLFVTAAQQLLITDGRYGVQARKEAKGFQIFISSVGKPTRAIFSEIVAKYNIRKILFDGSVTMHSTVEEMRQCLSRHTTTNTTTAFGRPSSTKEGMENSELISRKGMLQELRIIKEKREIVLLKKAADIACGAFTKLLPELHAGMTEKSVARRLEDLMVGEGADGIAFPTIVASGKNGAHPHAKASDKKIRKGELVTIDFGARFRGYVSDITRTVAIGKITPRLKKMYEAVRKAQELGCRKTKAGITGAEIDAVCRTYLAKKGYGKYFTHSTGHGIGMEIHELPHISLSNTEALPAGAIITCEPGVYIQNVGGVRIEDALVLTEKGNINLSKSLFKKLLILC